MGYQFNTGGGGVAMPSISANQIPKAQNSSSLVNSLFSDNGTNVTLGSGKLIIPSGSAPGVVSSGNNNTGVSFGTDIGIIRNSSAQVTFAANLAYMAIGLKLPGATKTTTYNMSQADSSVLCDATSAGFTVTLPAASGSTNGTVGQWFFIYKIDSSVNVVTIARAGADTINGAASKTLTTQYQGIFIVGAGATSWMATTFTAA